MYQKRAKMTQRNGLNAEILLEELQDYINSMLKSESQDSLNLSIEDLKMRLKQHMNQEVG